MPPFTHGEDNGPSSAGGSQRVKGAQARLLERSGRREKPKSLRAYRRPLNATTAAHADRRGKGQWADLGQANL